MDEDVEYKACDGSLEYNDGTDAFETKEQLYKYFKTQGIDFDDIDEESRLPKFSRTNRPNIISSTTYYISSTRKIRSRLLTALVSLSKTGSNLLRPSSAWMK